MEHKQTDALVTDINEEQGIVEAIWAVMGNIDEGLDRIHNGSFTKTFAERGNKVALLDNHRTDSVMSALGTVLALKEVNEAELPAQIKETYPDATGGAWGQFQFLTDTPEGKGAFTRIKKGAVRQWSFGYDALDKDYTTEETKDGEEITVRNLRTIKLYEVSPVLFAMNEATTTTDAKSASEGKPYGIFQESGKWAVYKVDGNGDKTGERLGLHDTEGEAEAQRRALYAAEEDDEKSTPGFTLSTKEHSRVNELIKELSTIFDGEPVEDDNSGKEDEAPTEETQAADEAGPETPTSSELLTLIEIEQDELELMEV
jgi:HK97 family phage prohead protease